MSQVLRIADTVNEARERISSTALRDLVISLRQRLSSGGFTDLEAHVIAATVQSIIESGNPVTVDRLISGFESRGLPSDISHEVAHVLAP